MISGSVPEPLQWFPVQIMFVFNAVPPEGLNIMSIQFWPLVFSLVFRDLSRFSKYLDDIMYCGGDVIYSNT